MRALSDRTVLALHALHRMLLKGGPVSTKAISASSHETLSAVRSVVGLLRNEGLIRNAPGRGFALAKAPGEISVLDIMRIMDAPVPPDAPCGGDYDACASHASCLLAPLCRNADTAFHEALGRFTLADLNDTAVELPNCLDPKLRSAAS